MGKISSSFRPIFQHFSPFEAFAPILFSYYFFNTIRSSYHRPAYPNATH